MILPKAEKLNAKYLKKFPEPTPQDRLTHLYKRFRYVNVKKGKFMKNVPRVCFYLNLRDVS